MLELMLAFGVAGVLARYISRRSLLVICFSAGLPAKSRVSLSPSTPWLMFKDRNGLSHLSWLRLSI